MTEPSTPTGPTPATPLDAATVVLLRDGPDGVLVYLVKRHTKSAFMGGVYVFPGGKVDVADADPVIIGIAGHAAWDAADRTLGVEPGRAGPLYVAAFRETLEEAGVWLGCGGLDDHGIQQVRDALKAGAPLKDVLESRHLGLSFEALRYFAHWITPTIEPRRFSARFFFAEAPVGQDGVIDAHEVTDGIWTCPDDAIARYAAGEIDLAPPTLRTLQVLTSVQTVSAALALATDAPVEVHAPELVVGPTPRLVLAGDPLHPTVPGEQRRRFELIGRRWQTLFE